MPNIAFLLPTPHEKTKIMPSNYVDAKQRFSCQTSFITAKILVFSILNANFTTLLLMTR